jgi:hypothetical protein
MEIGGSVAAKGLLCKGLSDLEGIVEGSNPPPVGVDNSQTGRMNQFLYKEGERIAITVAFL